MRPARRVLFSLVPLALLLGLGELAARVLWEPPPEFRAEAATRGTLLAPHPTRIWAPSPGALEQFGARAVITADHLRESPTTGAPLRALTLGDSSIFGHGVDDADTLHVRLGQALAARGVAVDVLCGGIPGYSTEQSRVLMEEVGWDLDPDLLVIGNFWSDSNVDNFVDRDWLDALRSPATRARRLLWQSHLLQLLRPRFAVEDEEGQRAVTYTAVTWVRDPLARGQRRVPVADYARNLDALITEAAARGVSSVLLMPSNRSRLRSGEGDPSSGPYREAMRRVAAHRGVLLVDSAEALIGTGHGADALFVDDLHPSGLANGLYAERLAGALVEAGWPGAPLPLRAEAPPFAEDIPDPFGGAAAFSDHVRRYARALAEVAEDPKAGAAGCEALDEGPDALDCALAVVEGLVDQGQVEGALVRCDRLKASASADACRWVVVGRAGRVDLCGRVGVHEALCRDRLARASELDALFAEGATLASASSEVLARLERQGLPPDHEPSWREVHGRLLPGVSARACDALAEDAARAACAREIGRRAEAWCRAYVNLAEAGPGLSGLPPFDEAMGLRGEGAWLVGAVNPGDFEDEVRARLAALGLPPDHACAWERVYQEVLRTEQPVRAARCARAPADLRPACEAAGRNIYGHLLSQAARQGALACEGPPPKRFVRLDDPLFLEVLAAWRAEGRCGEGYQAP